MKNARLLLLILVACFLPACGVIPSRLFQKAVPAPVQKSPAQLEAERQAADLLAKGIESPPSLIPVASGLSESLGKPQKPLVQNNPTREQVDAAALEAIKSLEKTILGMQKQIDAQNKFLAKYAGTKLEGTGIDLIGPGMFTVILILIVLGATCPIALPIMAFMYRRAKAALVTVVNGIEDTAKSPEFKAGIDAVKDNIATRMKAHKQPTTALKAVITNAKE